MAWEIVRFAAAAVATCFLPGWLLLDLLKWELCRDVRVSLVPLAFGMSVAVVSIVGVAGYAVGANTNAVLYAILVIDGLALARIAASFVPRDAGRLRALSGWTEALRPEEKGVLGFTAVAVAVAAWAGAWFSHTADTFYHLAAARSLIDQDHPLVTNLIYADSPAGLDPTSGSWHLVLALIAKMSGLDLVVVWTYLPPLMAVFLVLAFYTLAAVVLQYRWWALAATAVQFVVFFNMDFRTSPYPNVIVSAILWVGLAGAFRFAWQGDRRGFVAAGLMAFTLAAVHLFALELYMLSLGVFAGAALLLVLWRRHLWNDIKRAALLVGSGALLTVPVVFAKAQGARLVSTEEAGDRGFRQLLRVAGSLEDISLFNWLGDHVLTPITSLDISERAANHFYVFRPGVLADDILSGELATYLLVLLLIPGLLMGRRLSVYLAATTLFAPLVLFNPLLVTYLNGRVSDIAFLRLPQLVPNALVWVAVLAPMASRLGRLAQSRRLRLAQRYALACAHRWAALGRWGRAVPAQALVAVYGLLIGVILVAVTTFGAADIVNGTVDLYIQPESSIFSVQNSRKSAIDRNEGVFGYLSDNAPRDAVVLAEPVVAYYISGLVGTPVVAVPPSHSPRRVETQDGPQRRLDVARALNGHLFSTGLRIVQNYHVRYVLTDASQQTVFSNRPDRFRLVYQDRESRLYEFVE